MTGDLEMPGGHFNPERGIHLLDSESLSPKQQRPGLSDRDAKVDAVTTRGGESMSEETKKNGERIAAALEKLPEAKRERLLGFAEGVEAMSQKDEEDKTGEEA